MSSSQHLKLDAEPGPRLLLDAIDQLVTRAAARPHVGLLSVFTLALSLRVAFALWLPDGILWIDGQRYVKIAESLLAGQGFGSLQMNMIAVPTQPLLIAAFKALPGGSFTTVRMGFALLGAVTCVVGCWLGTRLFDARAGLLAGLILAIYPMHVYVSALFEVPQTFFVLVVSGAFLAVYRAQLAGDVRFWALSGGLFGLSALSVPTILPFLPCVVLWIPVRETDRSRWLPAMAAYSIGVVLALTPWATRNYLAYGHPILVNVAGGENFWKANSLTYFEYGKRAVALPCESGTHGEIYCAELARVQTEAERLGLDENEAILYADKAAWRGGLSFMQEHPLKFLQLTGRKFLSLFSPWPDAVSSAAQEGSLYQRWVAAVTYGPALILGLLGLLRSTARWREFLPVYAYLATLIVLYTLFVPTIRYRLPIDFFLVLFAADWLGRALRARASNHSFS